MELDPPSNTDLWAFRTAGGVHEGLLLPMITRDAQRLNIIDTNIIHTVDASTKNPANHAGDL